MFDSPVAEGPCRTPGDLRDGGQDLAGSGGWGRARELDAELDVLLGVAVGPESFALLVLGQGDEREVAAAGRTDQRGPVGGGERLRPGEDVLPARVAVLGQRDHRDGGDVRLVYDRAGPGRHAPGRHPRPGYPAPTPGVGHELLRGEPGPADALLVERLSSNGLRSHPARTVIRATPARRHRSTIPGPVVQLGTVVAAEGDQVYGVDAVEHAVQRGEVGEVAGGDLDPPAGRSARAGFLVSARTAWPTATSWVTIWRPTVPVAPVTRMVMIWPVPFCAGPPRGWTC